MLANVKTTALEPFLAAVFAGIGQGGDTKNPEPGIYFLNHFDFDSEIAEEVNNYPDFEDEEHYFNCYGVADSVEQVKERYAKWLQNPDKKYCISFTEVRKKDQPDEGGWRWHKWGAYIGNKDPQCEYLYDEDDSIQSVLCYHIYEILD